MPETPPAYPLMENAAEWLQAESGRLISDITLEAAASDALSGDDLKIRAETLQAQAQVARQAGYTQLAANLTRAAELTAVPNEDLLQMYEQLRPRRAAFEELIALAQKLEETYRAPTTAAFIREAALVYQTRGLLRRD